MRSLRAFIGIPLPKSYQDALALLRREAGPLAPQRLGWTRAGSWHLTLKFLGDINASGDDGLDGIIQALRGVDWAPFAMRGGGAGFFPDAGRPRVAWIGLLQGKRECAALAAAVELALLGLGFERETRPFAAHLTVARTRDKGRGKKEQGPRSAKEGWRDFEARLSGLSLPEFTVARFTLWQSVLGHEGPRYEPLADFPARR